MGPAELELRATPMQVMELQNGLLYRTGYCYHSDFFRQTPLVTSF